MKKFWKKFMTSAVFVICLAAFAACGKGGSAAFSGNALENEVFRIGDQVCRKEEMAVYLTNVQNQYERAYGAGIWNAEYDGITLEENVRETVLAKAAQIKTMVLMAEEREISLTQEEEALAGKAADMYFGSLNEREIELMGADRDIILSMYEDYARAWKLYGSIIQDINPEISDDEARIVRVEHILIRTYDLDEAGIRIPYSAEKKAEALSRAREAREKAVDGAHDFEALAAQYSDDETVTLHFGKGEAGQALETAFSLETGAVSDVIEDEDGYHIVKCISTFDREETDANKIRIVEQRRNEAFGQEYDAFASALTKELNWELWDRTVLIHDSQVKTDSFFDVYGQFFPQSF